MEKHELTVKNKAGEEYTVSINHYLANKGELTSTLSEKETDDHLKKYEASKAKAEKEADKK